VGERAEAPTATDRAAAFERFTQSRLDRAYRLATIILRDAPEAEDAVHDAAVRAWTHWGQLRDAGHLDAWFDRIVVNECRARMRGRTMRTVRAIDPVPGPDPDPTRRLAERDALNDALATLGPDHRIAVVLRYGAGLGPAEIAARTGDREGTVKSRLHYALRDLRAAIEAADRAAGDGR
jgi:RNA polymerase sigma-70 factor (ECF subfamily)